MSDEKKIQKKIGDVYFWLKAAESELKLYEDATIDKKKNKYLKNLNSCKQSIDFAVNRVIELGGSVNDIAENLNGAQLDIWNEMFGSSNTEEIEVNKEIQRIKKMLHEDLKEAMEKYSYDPAEPIETRRESKLYKVEAEIGQTLLNAGDETLKDSLLFKNDYRECWNYTRDYEATKDEYFTKEEQALMEHCVAIRMEDEKYRIEKNAFFYNLGTSLIESADKIGEWGDITQAKIWAKNLYQDVFPKAVEDIEGKLSKDELEKKSKEMTRRYIQFFTDPKAIEAALKIDQEIEGESRELIAELKTSAKGAENLLNRKSRKDVRELINLIDDEVEGQGILAYKLLEEKVGYEQALFIALYKHDTNRENRQKLFSAYSFEELGI